MTYPHFFSQGIIPADAGSTYRDRVIQGDKGDHPRRCGEHLGQESFE